MRARIQQFCPHFGRESLYIQLIWVFERGFCLLKGIAEGTYNSKHAEAARLYYTTTTTTTTTHIHTHTHLRSFKLGHAHERRCGPNH